MRVLKSPYLYIKLVILLLILLLVMECKAAGFQGKVIISGSMEPDYPVGCLILLKNVETLDIKKGDVITYQLGKGTYVTHRVAKVHKDGTGFTTKGDANTVVDPLTVTANSIQGKVVASIPYVGYLSIFMKNTPLGLVIILGFGILALFMGLWKQASKTIPKPNVVSHRKN